ncbi:ankyrin repeat and EF-hand domain-containing protein 1 isoform X2 [Anguilla anguilla]|uniref:ankyrin repeat and EF-hand domain-containing protein 1 isoform X2 n=1 Tax=Anguilla anguilla TaxID=7936 RepID=UPI0015A778AB|nr:ankyrin repeat and EF-hand domain-containing protein 1 isoform X2 [Anguilla anguilla]
MKGLVAEGRLELMQVYKLLQCVRNRDKAQIEKMARLGVPNLINLSEPQEGLSSLHQAAEANDGNMINFLLAQGALPDLQDKAGCTPAMRAAKLGHYGIIELLGSKGADMKAVDLEGRGVLFYCIYPTEGHLHCLEAALKNGADVNNISHKGKPVLVLACENAEECEEMCIDLLDKGADPDNADEETGRTALMGAARVGAVNLARAILQDYGKVNDVDNNKCHAAHFAAEGGFLEVLQLLSAYLADLGMVSANGNTPLHLAAAGGFAECCRFLAQRGCNPKLKNEEGLIARQIAKNLGNKAAMKEVKKAETLYGKYVEGGETNPNELWALTLHDWSYENEERLRNSFDMEEEQDDEESHEPVQVISKNTFLSVMTDGGAPVDAEKLEKIFAAHDKKREGKMNINDFFKGLEYLQKAFVSMSYGPKKKKAGKGGKGKKKKGKFVLPFPICVVPPDQAPRRSDGGPPHYMIEKYHHFTDTNRFSRDHPPAHPIVDDSAWYMKEPEKAFVDINHCVKRGDLESLSLALSQSVPVDVTDRFYKTPLMTACSSGNYQVAKFLIGQGADVNACDQFQWTPLHHACHAGQVSIIGLLVRSGADMDAVAMNGTTPLMRAIESCRPACVEHLLDAGANVHAQNSKEQNCLEIARAYGDQRIVYLVQTKLDDPNDIKEDKPQGTPATAQPKPSQDERYCHADVLRAFGYKMAAVNHPRGCSCS